MKEKGKYILSMDILTDVIKIFIGVSIFFVWVVRYPNIVEEFKEYGFPHWFREILGIIKCSIAVMLLIGSAPLTLLAALILSLLMIAAVIVHIRHHHTLLQMLPSFSLVCANSLILYITL